MLNVSEIIIHQQKFKGGHLMQINVILDRRPAAIEADNNTLTTNSINGRNKFFKITTR